MQNLNAKHYQLFNCEERLNLTLAAIARDDNEEMLLLQRSCPTRHYVGIDMAYKNRLQALFIIALQFCKYLEYYQHKLQITESLFAAFSFFSDSDVLLAEFQPKFGNMGIVETTLKLVNFIPKHQSALKSLCIALTEFCEEINVDYKNLLAMDKFNEEAGDLSQYLCSDAVRNEEIVKSIKDSFFKIWQAYIFE